MIEILIAKLGSWLVPIITGLGGILVFFIQRWRNKRLKSKLAANEGAVQILKQDAKTDKTTEENKNEVDKEQTLEELEDGFDKLRRYGK